MRAWLVALCAGSLLWAPGAYAQSQVAGEGEDLAKSVREGSASSILQSGAETGVPGYGGTNIDAAKYLDDAEGLTDAGVGARYGDPNYGVVIDPTRPEFDPSTIDLSGAKTVENDPEAFLGTDVAVGGSNAACEPVPGTGASSSTYFETCNRGSKVESVPRMCRITMVPETTTVSVYRYYAEVPSIHTGMAPEIGEFSSAIADGTCTNIGVADTCAVVREYGMTPSKQCARYRIDKVQCSREIPGLTGGNVVATGQRWYEQASTTTVTTRRVDSCGPLSGDTACTAAPTGEVCVEPGETRIIDGVPVTESCWAWQRDFTCSTIVPGNSDCSEVEAKPNCQFDHDECLSENEDGTCNVSEKVFRCTTPDTSSGQPPAYICGGDLYCINGECTQVEREASTEFKDAMVAVHAMGDVRDHFDPATMTLFNGTKAGCHKPVFGLVNCCAGKTSGVLSTATGAAALVAGPAAIAALATPFLTMFLCNSEEMMLDVKDRMGLCHYVGTYCSDKVLGVCTSKRKSYCCFESKLSRILQEQGRAQLGKTWGKPKTPDCKGFTPEEFQRLDLSQMDFTEVYSEFIDAAKVPDEVQTSIEIQDKIEEYYKLHGGTPKP